MKISIWCPFISEVATCKTVINTIKSVKKFTKNKNTNFKLINAFGEWDSRRMVFEKLNVDIIDFNKINLNFLLSKPSFILSRIAYIIIFIKSLLKLHFYLRDSKPSYLFCHLITSLPLFLLFFFNYETKIILRISGYPKLNFIRLVLWKLVQKKIHLTTCPSKDTYLNLKSLNIFDEKKIIYLPEPVLCLEELREKIKSKNIKEKNFNTEDSIVSIGRLTKQKNFDFLIKAMSEFLINDKNLKLFIIGEGEMEKRLANLISKLELNNQVFLLKYKNNVFKYLKSCKCFILSSLWEDPGYVLIEAAMSNATIISSNCPNGPTEILNNGNGGYLFNSNSLSDFKKKFLSFLESDKNLIHKKKIEAKKNIRQYTLFNHYKILNKHLKI